VLFSPEKEEEYLLITSACPQTIIIMRAFVPLREAMASSKELARRLDELEKRIASHDESIQALFQALRQLMAPKEPPKKQIGFQFKEKRASYSARG
jgi:hypothetical protein